MNFISVSLNELLEVIKHRHFKIRVQMYFGLDYNLKSALCIKKFSLILLVFWLHRLYLAFNSTSSLVASLWADGTSKNII